MVEPLPLAGERVLDLSRFVSGSYVAMVLAALGADVVKVESVSGGDPYRGQAVASVGGESALFLALNTGKRSVCLDFRQPAAAAAVAALLEHRDIVVQNARPGALTPYGLHAASVLAKHPRMIYASISGYGEIGPERDRGGFDTVLQADGGLMSVSGEPDGPPVAMGAPMLDIGSGLSAVAGILAAIIRRDRTGRGGTVESSLLEYSVAAMTTLATQYLASGVVPQRAGRHSPTFAPYGAFRSSDGWLVLAGAGSERLWATLCAVLERPELVADPRFATNADRVHHRDELVKLIEDALSVRTAADWADRLRRAGVPAGTVSDLAAVLASPQVEALGLVQTLEHPTAGPYRTVGLSWRLDGKTLPHMRPAPTLGADTAAVLGEVGVSAQEIDRLLSAGVAQ
jgi:crotonobetainyl-CoA:carnitine CoA-transferase CaiB-like acyl-CoA transferase